jgi:hypothetical protein
MDEDPCLVPRIVCLCVFRRSESSLLSSSQLVLFVRSIKPVRFYEPSDPVARGVPLKYFRFRPVAYRLHLPNFGVVIRFPPVDYLPLPPILRRQVHSSLGLPRVLPCQSCRSLPYLFPVRPTSFISALDVYQSYRCFLVWPCPFSP